MGQQLVKMLWDGVAHLSVEFDRKDVVGVTVVADLCPLLEVIDVHSLRQGDAHHDYQTAGEETFHDVDIWSLYWGKQSVMETV